MKHWKQDEKIAVFACQSEDAKKGTQTLLAHGVKQVFHLESLPEIGRAEKGKPFFPAHPNIHFNLSHSANIALCAVANLPIGADIQVVKDTFRPKLFDYTCDQGQRKWLFQHGDTPQNFALLWAMKESYVKYTGQGLFGTGRDIAVPYFDIPPQWEETTVCQDENGLFFTLYRGKDWCACVCAQAAANKIIWIE